MKLTKLDVLSLIAIIVEVVWRVIMENISAPRWMHYVEWVLIILIFVMVVLELVSKSKRNKQEKQEKED